MTDKMRTALGYDEMGNAPQLLARCDEDVMPRINRASGDVVCAVCGVKYYNHPPVQGALWATRTCEGIVKL